MPKKKKPQESRFCAFCRTRTMYIDYKAVSTISNYLDRATHKIRPRRKTFVCARHQRMLTVAIKRARQIALLPM